MRSADLFLLPSEAAERLGVSTKALRVYEEHGLVTPGPHRDRLAAYGPAEIARASEVAALRALGLGLSQIARVLAGEPKDLEPALAAHQAALEERARSLASTVAKIRDLRTGIAQGTLPAMAELARLMRPDGEIQVAFDLPWPWGGERFELRDIRALNYINRPAG